MKLIDLVGQVIELKVLFGGGFHFETAGRVRHYGKGADGEALWVGKFCCPVETEVEARKNGDGDIDYHLYVNAQLLLDAPVV